MSTTRITTHLISVALLLLWGGVQLYFYASNRVVHYVSPEGIFQPMVLISGIGLIILGIFNLATMGSEEAGCCGHDHAHDDHDHDHKDGCGHDHSHDHSHEHGKDCGHDHSHEAENKDCCGRDHAHDHSHEHGKDCGHKHDHSTCGHDHGHAHDHGEEDHGHGVLNESGPMGKTVAILILSVPIIVAAMLTPDAYSGNAIVNKGLYNSNYNDQSRASQFTLNKGATGKPTAATVAVATPTAPPAGASVDVGGRVPGSSASPSAAVAVSSLPPAMTAPANALPPATTTGEVAKNAAPATAAAAPAAAAKSYGTFTLADLKAQVPQSKDGNFILEVPELYYTAGDMEVQRVLAGQPIETKAQVMPEKNNNTDGKRLRILRLLVQCCAADARPYSVPIEFKDKAPTFKDMSWVEVKGTMSYSKEGDQTVPLVNVTSIKETSAPDNAMLY